MKAESPAETEIISSTPPLRWLELASKPAGLAAWAQAEWFQTWLDLAHK